MRKLFNTRRSIVATTVVIAAIAIVWAVFVLRRSAPPGLNHDPRESSISLSPAQMREVLDPGRDAVEVYRYTDSSGVWQVAIGNDPSRHQQSGVGRLFRRPVKDEINVPVYLCNFDQLKNPSISLDVSNSCSGEGKLLQREPAGYLSKKIRTGYLLAVRCLSREHGMYVSLNPRCESGADLVHGVLGSIRSLK